MASSSTTSERPSLQVVDGVFDDIDALAASALEWDQEYQQIGRGRFRGQLSQVVLGELQLGRESCSPGVLQRGAAPKDSWVFGLPLKTEGSLHIRRRQVQNGELLVATSRDDVVYAATGPTTLMLVVLPNSLIRRWMQVRRGIDGLDPDLPPRNWAVSPSDMTRRSLELSALLEDLQDPSRVEVTTELLARLESKISGAIFDMIPSAETVEALHSRARIARATLQVLYDRLNDPPNITELCEQVGARERTLYLSCVEAFGRPPSQLLLELRLNAVRRALVHPAHGATVTGTASQFAFMHFGRFAAMYARQFGERPSVTLAKSIGQA